jgi:hypothetical protein
MEFMTPEDYKKAAENGIPYNIAYARFSEYGWSVEKTVNEPVKKRGTGLWPQYRELATEHGVGQSTFYDRVKGRRRESPMEPYLAATTPITASKRRKKL